MPITVHCSCGKAISVPDSYAGRTGTCRGCGAPIMVPASNDAVEAFLIPEDDMMPVSRPPSPPSPIHVVIADDPVPISTGTLAYQIPGEPWYYKFLTVYASVLFWIGLIQFITTVLVIGLTLVLLPSANDRLERMRITVFLAPVFISLGVLIFFWLCSAPILLAVDAARNLRAIRWSSR